MPSLTSLRTTEAGFGHPSTTAQCALDHVLCLFSNGGMGGDEHDLPFKIELWDDADRHVEEVIALASDFASACGAYEEAVKRRPGKLITLRQKARVIKKSL